MMGVVVPSFEERASRRWGVSSGGLYKHLEGRWAVFVCCLLYLWWGFAENLQFSAPAKGTRGTELRGASLGTGFRMTEESVAPSTSVDKTDSVDVDGEAKKLLGLGQKNLVMGDIPAAVNAFQEAASMLGKKYGETANECAEAFFFYGKSLLELARMENGVLGNALEGVQVEEEEEKAEDSMAESADNVDEEAREELREQVYNAMGEKDEPRKTEEPLVLTEAEMQLKSKDVEMKKVKEEKVNKEAVDAEHKTYKEREEEEVNPENQMKAAEREKQGTSEIITEVAKEDCTVMKDIFVAAEKQMGVAEEQKPVTAEEAGEDTTINKPMTTEEAAGAQQAVSAQEAVGEEKPVEAAAQEEKVKEAAAKLVDQDAEKQTDSIVEKTIVEEVLKTSGATIEELARAVEKAESQVETAIENKQPARAIDEKAKEMETTTEQVVIEVKEREEPLSSGKALPPAASEITPAAGTEPSQEMQIEEKAEAAKVEKEEEKDDEMGEGEETEGSEEEDKENDKTEEDKENDSTVEEKESEEDEVGNLELAWDMLELAKVIYKRQDTKEAQLHAAQAHLKLGEVSIESENYIQAIEEFHSCLTLQQKYLEAHDRLLAETHYHLGLAYHYNNQYDEAVLQFSKSMEVIDKRMVMLTERLRAKGEGLAEDEKEIEELKGLLPEIKEKIEDSKESQKSARVAELALKATLVGGSSSSFSQGTESSLTSANSVGQTPDGASQCITDISHLVRKKTEERPQIDTVESAV
ncbi:nuclear autoantigenic sperm protein isoform X2 [Heteronotia binoei]|uniref:nuclear autoantigenic sperm protein isoform X2 n=1 Tax=Heteronotia binoei TaxID=13085 RepID=UPI00292D379F|nr:nuclear autoantigenic sperm protein isoform X2 [Heteronotia binoei]